MTRGIYGSPVHGTATMYRYGCKCDSCREAKTTKEREYRRRRALVGVPVHKSGQSHICDHCGASFKGRSSRKFCSSACAARRQGGELGSPKRPPSRWWISVSARLSIYEAANFVCALCNEPMCPDENSLHDLYPTLDHIVPRARGGSDDPSNLQPAHRICNLRKGSSDGRV